MVDDTRGKALTVEQVRALALEMGVREEDIRTIIDLVGPDRPSIVREARYLKKARLN